MKSEFNIGRGRNEIGFAQKCAMQRCNIAIANNNLWPGANGLVIQQRQQAGGAVAAADTEIAFTLRSLNILIKSPPARDHCRPETPALAHVGREQGLEAKSLQNFHGTVDCPASGGALAGAMMPMVSPKFSRSG